MRGASARSACVRGYAAAALAAVVVFLVICFPIATGRVSPRWDADVQAAPAQMLVADHARAGRLVGWNPWTTAGSPDHADPQTGAYSPLAVGMGLLTGSKLAGFIVYWLTVWLLGGIGVILLARSLKAPPWAAFLAATGFLFSGLYLGQAQHLSHLHTVSWVPLILWRLDAGLRERRLWPAAQAGSLWGLSALAGHPGLVVLTWGFAMLWTAGRALFGWPEKEDHARLKHAALCLVLAAGTGAAVMSPIFAGLLADCPGYTGRAGPMSIESASRNSLHPRALTTFSSPYLHTLGEHSGLWEYTDYSTASVYLGPLVFCLALFALAARPRDRWRWWMFGTGTLFLLCSMARTLPLYSWLHALFPPVRFFRGPVMFRDFWMITTVVLALSGARDLDRMLTRRDAALDRRLLCVCLLAGPTAIWIFFRVLSGAQHEGDAPGLAAAHALAAWLSVCGFAAAAVFRSRLSIPKPWLVGGLCLVAAADAASAFRLSESTVYDPDPALRADWARIEKDRPPSFDLLAVGKDRILEFDPGRYPYASNKNAVLRLPALRGYNSLENGFHAALAKIPGTASMALGPSRVWFSPGALEVPADRPAFETFRKRLLSGGKPVMLVHSPEAVRSMTPGHGSGKLDAGTRAAVARMPPAARIPVRWLEYRPERLGLRVEAPSDGWLLVTDRWAPGWRATVNDKEAELWAGTFIFRAVRVRRGANKIFFEYRPFGFPYLTLLSWATLLAVLGGPWLWRLSQEKATGRSRASAAS